MRISTRGLLVLTTVVAVYAATAAILRHRGALDLRFEVTDWILFVFAGASIVWPVIRDRRSLGRGADRFRRRFAAAPHFGLAIAAGVFAWFHRGPENAFHFWMYFPLVAACHTATEFAASVFVGEPGVLAGAKLLAWREYDFAVEGKKVICVPKRYSSERKTQRYALVSEDAEVLRDLLAAKQTDSEA